MFTGELLTSKHTLSPIMKKHLKIQAGFLLFFLLHLSLFAQKYHPVQIEFGTGVITSTDKQLAAAIPISLALKTKKGIFDFSLKYQRTIKPLGVDSPRSYLLNGYRTLYSTLSSPSPDNLNRVQHWESFQIWGDAHINFSYFKPIIGFGLSLNRIRSFKKKLYTGSSTNTYIITPPNYYSWSMRLGHKVGKMRFYFEYHQNRASELPPLLYLGTALNFGLSPKQRKRKTIFSRYEEAKFFEKLIFRIEITSAYIFLINKDRNASALSGGLNMQFRLLDTHFMGISTALMGRFNGLDRGTQTQAPTNATDQVRHFSFYYRNNQQLSLSKAFYFGGGIGLYTLPGELKKIYPESLRYSQTIRFHTQHFLGLNAHIGLRSGLLSNTLTLHFPFKEQNTFVEYKLGIGLSFHK